MIESPPRIFHALLLSISVSPLSILILYEITKDFIHVIGGKLLHLGAGRCARQ